MKKIFCLFVLILSYSNIFSQVDLSNINLDEYYDSLRTSMVGKELPNIIFTDSLGNSFDLNSLKGKMVAINVWAFGCKPCISEIPELNKLVDEFQDKVKFISLLGSGPIKFNTYLSVWLKKLNVKYTTLSTNKNLYEAYGLLAVFPTHIIIDRQGKVLDLILGPNVKKIKEYIVNGLKQK